MEGNHTFSSISCHFCNIHLLFPFYFMKKKQKKKQRQKVISKEDLSSITTSLLLVFVQQKAGFVIIPRLFSLWVLSMR